MRRFDSIYEIPFKESATRIHYSGAQILLNRECDDVGWAPHKCFLKMERLLKSASVGVTV